MRADRPSHTAKKIARGMVFLGRTPGLAELLPEGAAEWTEKVGLATGVMAPWMVRLYGSAAFRGLAHGSQQAFMRGGLVGSALRKRFVDDQTRQAIDAGAQQVLVVGSGFDALCPRLAARHEDVLFVEVDHPSTMRVKKAGVEKLGAMRENLHLVAADLSTASLEDTLSSIDGWRSDASSVVVAEGVLMYLDASDVAGFLDAVHRTTGPGSRLVVTLIEEDVSAWLRLSLSMIGEKLRWGIKRAEVAPFLAEHGFELLPGSADLRATYLEPLGRGDEALPMLEHVAAALRV